MRKRNLLRIIACLIFLVMSAHPSLAQEKKNIRMVFVSLAWNSEIPFRVALARGFFKQQGLQVEPILIRGGPAVIAALVFARAGLQQMLDEDIRTGLVDRNFTLDRVVDDRILKTAQQELRAEGRIK